MPTDATHAVVCVLHGDPVVPPWLHEVADRLHLTVNDPAPAAYAALPAARWLTINEAPRGFAANVNAALAQVWTGTGPPAAVCVNFDLAMAANVPDRLTRALLAEPGLALTGAVLTDATGAPVFSVGRPPTSLKELTRALGLRSGGPQRLVRTVLRRLPAWQQRNAPGGRLLAAGDYLPWTCVAVRRQAWEQVGPLDERFFLYAEDMDWGRRAAAAGWQARLVDAGPVVHAERATRNPETDAHYERSHALFHAKWERPEHLRWQQRGLRIRRAVSRPSRRLK